MTLRHRSGSRKAMEVAVSHSTNADHPENPNPFQNTALILKIGASRRPWPVNILKHLACESASAGSPFL